MGQGNTDITGALQGPLYRTPGGVILPVPFVSIMSADGLPAGGSNPLPVAGTAVMVGASFTTPAGVTPYSIGDIIADNATGALVTPMQFAVARQNGGTGMVRRARIKTPDTGFAGGSGRLHLYRDKPTATNGDNGVWLTTESTYLGSLDITFSRTFTDFVKGIGTPNEGSEINFDTAPTSQIIYGLLEGRSVITPQGAKAISSILEVLQS